jgi:hypothetical protein
MDIISVFIQNKPGRLLQIVKEIKGMKILGFSIADAGEFGIVRICVDKPQEAMKSLKSHDLIATLTPGIAIEDAHLEKATTLFDETDINIDDAIYAVIVDGKPLVALRVSDADKAQKILLEAGVPVF